MTQNTNPRRATADDLYAAAQTVLGADKYTVTKDATNPYAFVVACGDKNFRVVVKELA